MSSLHHSTHWLKCSHQIAQNGYDYRMACDIIKKMKDGRLKIRVYGNRVWGGNNSRIRYVNPWRVSVRETLLINQ